MKMVVMLIWIGGVHGGPATIQGFHSLTTCEMARSAVEAATRKTDAGSYSVYTGCIEVAP